MPPLPHHRAYGSVPRRFGGLSIHQLCHRRQTQTSEARVGEGALQPVREAQPPWPFWAEDGLAGRRPRHAETPKLIGRSVPTCFVKRATRSQHQPFIDGSTTASSPTSSSLPERPGAFVSPMIYARASPKKLRTATSPCIKPCACWVSLAKI